MIATREISARELLEHLLARLERHNPAINAVVTLDVERARAIAAARDAELARGEHAGPLHGVPMTVKDAIETGGIRSTGGAVELTDHVPNADAPAVARLRAAGAVVFGKTNLPRWSGDLQAYNEMFGTTNNPWDLTRGPGGSSGGAAAAVAAGLTPLELGTDIGGSVRIPSHFCGVCGHKPSFGVVSQRGYLDHVGGGTTDADINVFGPIARTVDDLALALDVLAGPDDERAPAWQLALPPPRHTTLAEYRIGAWLDDDACPVSSDARAVLETALAELERAGAKIDRSARPAFALGDAVGVFMQLVGAAISVSLPDGGPSIAHRDWLSFDQQRMRLRDTWRDFFRHYDVLLCPVTPTAAFPHQHDGDFLTRTITIDGVERPYLHHVFWTGMVGVALLPSTVPPAGRTTGGLPVGIQVVGPYLEDRTTLDVAQRITDVLGGFTPPPAFVD
jgi:amidase